MDRALVTVSDPEQRLVEVDLRANESHVEADLSVWKTDAFRSTRTGGLTFNETELDDDAFVGDSGWYLGRAGF